MNNKDQVIENSNYYVRVINKILFFILSFTSISFLLILFSFHPEDSGWGFFSENIPRNLYGEMGAFLSGLVIREFGLLPGLLLSLLLFIWSLKFFNGSKINFFKIKIITIIFMIIFSSLGGSYIESFLLQKFNFSYPIINQNGLSEWFLFNLSNKVSNLMDVSVDIFSVVLGVISTFLSIALFLWISSAGLKEIKFFKFLTRPIFLPVIWILTIFFNLFFYDNQNKDTEMKEQKIKLNFFQIIKDNFLKLKSKKIARKKPKIRKSPILIKNIDTSANIKKKRDKFSSYQDDLPLGSESGFVLPSINLLTVPVLPPIG